MPRFTQPEIIRNRISQVRDIMKNDSIDVYIIMTGDYHMSEYADAYFAEREYMSGFTGSAGTLVITKDEAALFTDGRYFGQAQEQINNTGIMLMKMGVSGFPTVNEYCIHKLPYKGRIGFDGRTVPALIGIELSYMVKSCEGSIDYSFNAVEKIWNDRPDFPCSKVYALDDRFTGEELSDKLKRVRQVMAEYKADAHVISSLDDICWLFNIRGDDVECNPVIMSYALITEDEAVLYTDICRFDETLADEFNANGIQIKEYGSIYEDIRYINNHKLSNGECVNSILVDFKRINMNMYSDIPDSVRIINKENPTVLMKAKKNIVEINNLKSVHIDDGLAVTRFMFWLKDKMKHFDEAEKITEVTAAEYLDNLRSRIHDYIELSFPTISAYKENAAMMHYAATKDNCALLYPEGALLVDSGGQYYRGTTDVTRTIGLGNVSDEFKKHFTLTLKGMLHLTNARFLKGCTGFNLDILAREPLWNEGIDYRCGTGHGIGYLLNVHESPNGFRWKHNPGHNDLCVIEEGMVTSNEPGVYIDGKYGIRIENEILCVRDYENEYGTFLKFETLTYVPIDIELIDVKYLDDRDIILLNNYHKRVYENLSPFMSDDELDMLKKYTAPVSK